MDACAEGGGFEAAYHESASSACIAMHCERPSIWPCFRLGKTAPTLGNRPEACPARRECSLPGTGLSPGLASSPGALSRARCSDVRSAMHCSRIPQRPSALMLPSTGHNGRRVAAGKVRICASRAAAAASFIQCRASKAKAKGDVRHAQHPGPAASDEAHALALASLWRSGSPGCGPDTTGVWATAGSWLHFVLPTVPSDLIDLQRTEGSESMTLCVPHRRGGGHLPAGGGDGAGPGRGVPGDWRLRRRQRRCVRAGGAVRCGLQGERRAGLHEVLQSSHECSYGGLCNTSW